MKTNSNLKSKTIEFDIKKHCHINTNIDNDTFVGIKIDSEDVKVYFPIGYKLSESDKEIRKDINNLLRVLNEFTDKRESYISKSKSGELISVNFPIDAYKYVIEYYLSMGGKYYVETDTIYKKDYRGKKHWSRTIKNSVPFIQKKEEKNSFIFTSFIVQSVTPNNTKLITQINRFCVYEAFRVLGWIYVPYMPDLPGVHPDIKTSIRILKDQINKTNDDRKRLLFNSMMEMLEYIAAKKSSQKFYYGTEKFEYIWEKLIDRVFGEKNKNEYFPTSNWSLKYNRKKKNPTLRPDTIMIFNNNYYIIDAKYYKYGLTGKVEDLPGSTSINKQITYGEYLEKSKGIEDTNIFNAFVMPYNMNNNPFGISLQTIENIGEASGGWRHNEKYYEHIQGIVIDTRYLMYNYSRNTNGLKELLIEKIEEVKNGYENEVPAYAE